MKIGRIHPCICVSHIPDSGDSGHYGMPNLQIYQSGSGQEYYFPACPVCGRGGMFEFKTAYLALKHWNELQEQLWSESDGHPLDDAPKPEPQPDPRDGYGDWHKAHQTLHIPEGDHFRWHNQECRIRSDGAAVLVYDGMYNDWLCPGYPQMKIENLLEHPEELEPLPFEKWHVEAGEPTWVWKRYMEFKFR